MLVYLSSTTREFLHAFLHQYQSRLIRRKMSFDDSCCGFMIEDRRLNVNQRTPMFCYILGALDRIKPVCVKRKRRHGSDEDDDGDNHADVDVNADGGNNKEDGDGHSHTLPSETYTID